MSMYRALRALLVWLARVNVLFALCLGATAWAVQRLLGLAPEPRAPLVVLLTMFSIYTLDRVGDREGDERTHPERVVFAGRHARVLTWLAVGAYGVALAVAWSRGPWAVACAALPLVSLALYSLPFVPREWVRRWGWVRLKERLGVKSLVVAGTLAALGVLMPVAVAGGGVRGWAMVLVGGALLGRMLINVVVFDIRDEEGDRHNGVRTLPVVLGRERTLRWLQGLNGALALLALGAPLSGQVGWGFATLVGSSLYAGAYLWALPRSRDVHFLCDVVVDGELLVLAGLVALGTG